MAAAGRPHFVGSARRPQWDQEQIADLKQFIEIVACFVIGVQVVMGLVILQASRKIAKNEVELADLLREAVSQIESDLPKK